MNRDLRKGILTAGRFYGIGFLILLILYGLIGNGYAHAPHPSLLLMLLMLIFGFLWLLSNLYHIFINSKDRYHLGSLITHSFVLAIAISFIGYKVLEDAQDTRERDEERRFNENVITVTSFGDTVEGRIGGNVLYYKVKDSVYFNFIDSTKIAEFEVVEVKKY